MPARPWSQLCEPTHNFAIHQLLFAIRNPPFLDVFSFCFVFILVLRIGEVTNSDLNIELSQVSLSHPQLPLTFVFFYMPLWSRFCHTLLAVQAMQLYLSLRGMPLYLYKGRALTRRSFSGKLKSTLTTQIFPLIALDATVNLTG